MRLEVKNLYKNFGEAEILHGISFDVESGKAMGLLGRNGAGKTDTTIRIIMNVFRANRGEVLLDGRPMSEQKVSIGYLPEERGLYPKKKVGRTDHLSRLPPGHEARAGEKEHAALAGTAGGGRV